MQRKLGSVRRGAKVIAEGTRLFALAGRPTKAQFVMVYGPKGTTMTWARRTEAGVSAEKFQSVLKLNKEEGLTVLLVERKLPFARRVVSEFSVLVNGRRVTAGTIGELTDEVLRAYLSV